MNDREAIRVMQPDGTVKIIFRTHNDKEEPKKEPENKDLNKHANNKENKKKMEPNSEKARYYNPLFPGHVDILGKDLLNKDLIFYLANGETIHGKMTGYAVYEVLVEVGNKKFIVMKAMIVKIEIL